jgi:hypothetical protein
MEKKLFIYSIVLLFIGCASPSYKFQSVPSEAEVTMTTSSGEKKSLGKTPISISANEVNPRRDGFTLEFKKEGFATQNLTVIDSVFSKNIEANITLAQEAHSSDPRKLDSSLNEVATLVADIQRDIQTKNYEIAMTKLTKLQVSYPNVATVYSLMGNVHFLERRMDRALVNYKKAIAINPNLFEVQKMVERIESMSAGGTR